MDSSTSEVVAGTKKWAVAHGEALEKLQELPDNSIDSIVCDDLAAGLAGEHLVCAELLLAGYRAFLTDQNCPYDLAVEHEKRLIRVQVKTTRAPRPIPQRRQHVAGYMWNVRRAGKAGKRGYADDAFDIVALVALDTREIAYMPLAACAQTVCIRPTAAPGYQQTGVCAGCGCDMGGRTTGCAGCRSRHWRREQRVAPQGKRFADYPFNEALDALTGRG